MAGKVPAIIDYQDVLLAVPLSLLSWQGTGAGQVVAGRLL